MVTGSFLRLFFSSQGYLSLLQPHRDRFFAAFFLCNALDIATPDKAWVHSIPVPHFFTPPSCRRCSGSQTRTVLRDSQKTGGCLWFAKFLSPHRIPAEAAPVWSFSTVNHFPSSTHYPHSVRLCWRLCVKGSSQHQRASRLLPYVLLILQTTTNALSLLFTLPRSPPLLLSFEPLFRRKR